MITRLVVFIVAAVVLLSGCAQFTAEETFKHRGGLIEKQTAGGKWKSVDSETGGVELEVPKNWDVKSPEDLNTGPNKIFSAFGPRRNQFNANLQVAKVAITGNTLNAFISGFEDNTRAEQGMQDFRSLNSKKIDITNGQATQKKYAVTLQRDAVKIPLVFEILFIRRGDRYYVVQLAASDKSFDSQEPVFDHAVKSLRFD